MASAAPSPTTPTPPANVEAEAVLLGALMIENRLVDRVADIVRAEDFHEQLHGRIYSLVVREASAGRPANPITLRAYLSDDPALAELGGNAYLAKLTANPAAAIGAEGCARQIAEMARRRRIIAALTEASTLAADMSVSNEEVVSAADAAMAEDRDFGDGVAQLTASAAVRAFMGSLDVEGGGVTAPDIPGIEAAIGPIRPHHLMILGGRPGMGKAQPRDAKVLTLSGWKCMGEISVGDDLASPDGAPSRVTGVFPQGEKAIYRVSMSDGRSAECCDEHLWKVRYRDWPEDRILSTGNLRSMLSCKRYVGRLSIDLFEGEFGVDQDQKIDPWLLGILLGDGCFRTNHITLSSPDSEILDRVRDVLPAGISLNFVSGVDYGISAKAGRKNVVLDALRHYGLAGRKAQHKFIPDPYLRASSSVRREVLRGLLDSDGWVEKHGTVRFASASEALAKQVQYLVRSLGGLCKIAKKAAHYSYRGDVRQGLPSFVCTIRHMEAERLVTLPKKLSRVGRAKNSVRLNILAIEEVRTAEAQCISVSHPSRLYVTDDFIVTHNTATAMTYGLSAARAGHGVLFVSLEMSSEQLMGRAMAEQCFTSGQNVAYDAIRDHKLTDLSRRYVMDAGGRISCLPLAIIDASSLTIGRLNMIVRRWKRRFEAKGQSLDLVIVDYLQLVRPDHRTTSPVEAVSEVSRGLKAIAKTYGLGVMALAQLNRAVEQREDKRPKLSDLRESGQIEQDADSVLFLYRHEYYLRQAGPGSDVDKYEGALAACEGVIEFIGAKRRDGLAKTVRGEFHGRWQAVRGGNP